MKFLIQIYLFFPFIINILFFSRMLQQQDNFINFNFDYCNHLNYFNPQIFQLTNFNYDYYANNNHDTHLKIEKSEDFGTKSHEDKLIGVKSRKTWTQEQDMRILEVIQTYNLKQYKKMPYKIIAKFLTNRTSKQIRERYLNKLDEKILETSFSQVEDQKIYKFYLQNGPKWKKLSSIMKGRTNTSLKNRFNVKLKQRLFSDPNLLNQKHIQTNLKLQDTNQKLIKVENTESRKTEKVY